MVEPSELIYGSGVALGQLLGLATGNNLGELTPDDAADKASIAAASPVAIASVLGIPAENAGTLNMDEVRNRLMSSYFSAKAADDFVGSKEFADEFRDHMIAERRAAMFRNAAVAPDQAERIRFDADHGDVSALNRVREQFFFE